MSAVARLGVILPLALLAGCGVLDSRQKAELPLAPRPPVVEAPSEMVYIDFAVVERPLGDEYLNRGLWEAGDEGVVPLESVLQLESNGLRACRLGGSPPPELQALLAAGPSLRQPRHQPRRLRTQPGQPVQLALGPKRDTCRFELRPGDGPQKVELKGVECVFEVLPKLSDGELSLRFVPQARYEEVRRRADAEVAPDGSLRWGLAKKAPAEGFPAAALEVKLAPGEFLVVGPRMDRRGTLGATWFAGENESGPTQKLIVLRAAWVSGTREEGTGPNNGAIALQVGEAKVRGMRP